MARDEYIPDSDIGMPGWTYKDKVNEHEWTYGEIAALYGGNEYMTDLVCECMKGQDPVACRDALEARGAIRQREDGGYAFVNEYPTTEELVDYIEFYLPARPGAYEKTTKNGYTVLERFEQPGSRLDVLAAKQMKDGRTEYVVAHGYDVVDGSWSFGSYAYSLADAVVFWDENRGFSPERAAVLDAPEQSRSVAIPVEAGYLVAEATVGRDVEGPGSEISLSLFDKSGELIHDFALLTATDSGRINATFFELGQEWPSVEQEYSIDDIEREPVSWNQDRVDRLQLPDRRDPELDARIVGDAESEAKETAREGLTRFEIGGVEGETWSVTVDAHSEAEALELAEQAYEAYFKDPTSPERMAGVVEFDHGWDVDHTARVWAAYEAPAERRPGELKSAGKAPKQPGVEKATPARDEAAVKQSAAARGVEAPAAEKSRKK